MKHQGKSAHFSDLLLGVAYYPEQVDESEWATDAALMARLGLNCIRIGEFCLSRLQKSDGTLTLDWLERVVDLFAGQGIRTILCTPTAAPPAWVVRLYPDLPMVTPDGRVGLFGGRRHYSVFHEGYRDLCHGIASALAERFGKHPAIIGWQIDNEVGSYSIIDCSAPALRAFHNYLARRYADVNALNRAWGLVFWNQEVESFDQVPAPTEMMTTRSPSHILEYNRFCLQGAAEFILLQAEAIRRHAESRQFITSNCEEAVSHALFRIQREQGISFIDLPCVDNYPELLPGAGRNAMRLDRYRCFESRGRFWAFELQTGSSFTTTGALEHRARRFWALETLARGGRSLLWFHWRRFRAGCEWRHGAILEMDRRPRSAFESVRQIAQDARRLEPILRDAVVETDVQILLSLDNVLARDRASEPVFWLEIQLPDFLRHRWPMWEKEVLRAVYNPLCALGLTVGFVTEESEWDRARPLIALDVDICSDALAAKLHHFCENGGTLIVFPGAGERDACGCNIDTPPGKLRGLLGVALKDYYPLAALEGATFDPATGRLTREKASAEGAVAEAVLRGQKIELDVRHGEVLDVGSAQVLAQYENGPCTGEAVITENAVGRGRAIYLGAVPTGGSAQTLYRKLLPDLAVRATPYRVVKIRSSAGQFVFLLNETPKDVALEKPVEDELTGKSVSVLPAFGVVLMRR